MSDAHGQPRANGTALGRPDGNMSGLTKENLLFTFPISLRENPSIAVLGDMMAQALAQRPEEIGRLSIYPRIDELPEDLLDILAYDFKVDWWDPDWSLEEKRRVFKSSWYVHKHMGTKAAVETAISAVYPGAKVQEWFEYGGQPYCFRLHVDLPEDEWTPERHRRLMWQLYYYKNLRSHLDSVNYKMQTVELENWRTMRLCFSALLIRTRANNFRPDCIRLNGERRLDGSWVLDQGVIWGPALELVLVALGAREREGLGAEIRMTGSASGRRRAAFPGMLIRAGTGNAVRDLSMNSVRITTGLRNRASAGAGVVEDTMWRLDATYRLNGKKRLNAEIVRSEL